MTVVLIYEDVFGDDFVFSKTMIICLLCPLLCWLFFFWKGAKGELSYKVTKTPCIAARC
jgi:DMSO/TMAO reductase YedYZ heme-binding membrane subunit